MHKVFSAVTSRFVFVQLHFYLLFLHVFFLMINGQIDRAFSSHFSCSLIAYRLADICLVSTVITARLATSVRCQGSNKALWHV